MTENTGIALVAGASRGLGLLIARDLLERGYDVAISARDSQELDAAKAQLDGVGPRVVALPCDVRDADAVRALVADVEGALGPLDVAVHVAGIIQVGPAVAAELSHFDDAIDTMLRGPIHLAWAVLPGMRDRRRGRIGVVTSIGGVVAPPHLLPYSTAKFGAVGFTEGLAVELSGTGVTASAIVPGLMRTGSHRRARFFGDAPHEYAWFGPAASLPLLSMDARRAAARMVDGVLAGKPVVQVGLLARVASRVHGLLPGTTVRALGIGSRLLPSARPDQSDLVEGREASEQLGSGIVRRLTTLGDRAARRHNEG
ncbi:SDR family NAD(P)-dependent oxidoreductase [Nigerium massiliense]|uniref:SDR family NAD(P)-dependent oxidoreductase n=1 Tax=Nigerium massiliense TaxID=1522317 RepID=UPI00058C2E37|nr:SDR family oxidoreductase [Nigerium massiliense]